MLVQPGLLMAGRAAGETAGGNGYAEFEAHITALATSGNRPWGALDTVQGNWITTAGPPTGVMIGSPWMNYMAGQAGVGSPPCRIVQHGLPSEAVFYDQVNNARKVYFDVTSLGRGEEMYGQTRNGYTSVTDLSGYLISVCRLIIYWDGEKAQKMDPYLGTGPTLYDW